jgi:hypothetical protein
VVAVAAAPEVTGVPVSHRIDIFGALGSDFWSSGVQGSADPSFAFTLGGGYTFGSPLSRVRFRMGALLGYTFLSEASSKETFLSFFADPTLEVRLDSAQHWFASADLGLGVLAISGLKPSSALLVQGQPLMIKGSQGLGASRLGLAVQYRLSPELGLFVSSSVSNASKKDHFYADITRTELMFGVAYRF